MLKSIQITDDKSIVVKSSEELVAEAEARTHKTGRKSHMDLFLADKTRLRRKPGWYPEDKKIEVATLFAAGVTNSTELERLTGVKSTSVREWRTSDWWPELLERIHVVHDQETVSTFTKIVDKALDVIQDRLINGDYAYDKQSGEVYRKPVSMRDAASVSSTIVDKRQLLRGKPTSRSESVGINDRLLKLAQEFKKMAEAKDITSEVEVIHEVQE